ncbi:serine/threonine protein kinase [Malassezia psittaci]|uniref:Serine/threonine protein kinase n=1 Tax=Malassezia psittaci TaxID=1821823 RepID=A0AAF0FAX8_9BASI|nr:serine/threonine protein kinase [Malassezia psittaci]
MPLEHFGAPRLGESSSSRVSRPLSEPGLPDKLRRGGVGRAASDAHTMTQSRNRLREERKLPNDDEDSNVLSKLTGVSRSVSWGRVQAEENQRNTLNTPKAVRSTSARLASGSGRLRPQSIAPSLSMSPTSSPYDPLDNGESHSQKSSPASSAAFSLRSISSLSRDGSLRDKGYSATDDTHRSRQQPSGEMASSPSPYLADSTHGLVLSPKANAATDFQHSEDFGARPSWHVPVRTATQERLDQELPPIPILANDDAPASKLSPVPALDLAVPIPASPRTTVSNLSSPPTSSISYLSEWNTAQSRPDPPWMLGTADVPTPSIRERSSIPESSTSMSVHEMLQFSIARKHAGGYHRRPWPNPMTRSLQSLPADETTGSDGGGSSQDTRSRPRFARFLTKLFNDTRSSSAGSDSDSLQSFSPRGSFANGSPAASVHPAVTRDAGGKSPLSESQLQRTPYTSTTSLMQLASAPFYPRTPRSPRVGAVPTQDDDLSDSDESREIHGLTPRSGTPARVLSPTVTRRSSASNLQIPSGMTPVAQIPSYEAMQDSSRPHTIDDYDIGEDMGSGAYGFVRRARLLQDGPDADDVVIKYIVKSCILADSWRRHRTYGTIPAEIFVLLQLQQTPYTPPSAPPPWIQDKSHWLQVRQHLVSLQQQGHITGHPGICKLLDFFEDEEYYYLVMPRFGDGRDLFEYVESSKYGLDPAEIRNFLGQVCDVMAYLHANNIVHRDIKDENVILDRFGMTQLIDFGSAARVRANRLFDTFSGTMDYAAAEIIQGDKYAGFPQDIWAFGVMAYVLVCGECPFQSPSEAILGLANESRPMQLLRHFCFDEANAKSESELSASSESHSNKGELLYLYDMIVQCLKLEPDQRPAAADLLRHRFLIGSAGWSGTDARRTEPASDRLVYPTPRISDPIAPSILLPRLLRLNAPVPSNVERGALARDFFVSHPQGCGGMPDNVAPIGAAQSESAFGLIDRRVSMLALSSNESQYTPGPNLDAEQQVELALQEVYAGIQTQKQHNAVLEHDVGCLDARIALLIADRKATTESFEDRKPKSHTNVPPKSLKAKQPSENHKQPQDTLQLYADLLYLLRIQPQYLARLCQAKTRSEQSIESLVPILRLLASATEQTHGIWLAEIALYVLKAEMQCNTSIDSMLRPDTPASRLLRIYFEMPCMKRYLSVVLSPYLQEIMLEPEKNWEIDPQKVAEELEKQEVPPSAEEIGLIVREIVQFRAEQLQQLVARVNTSIIQSTESIPTSLNWLCAQLGQVILQKYPNASVSEINRVIGTAFYLRFVNPAIVSPQTYGLLDIDLAKRPRRALMLVAKTLQTLANHAVFPKEGYMQPMSRFLDQARESTGEFLRALWDQTADNVAVFHAEAQSLSQSTLSDTVYSGVEMKDLQHLSSSLVQHLDQIALDDEQDCLQKLLTELKSAQGDGKSEPLTVTLPVSRLCDSLQGTVLRSPPSSHAEVSFRSASSQELWSELQEQKAVLQAAKDQNSYLENQLNTYKSYLHNARIMSGTSGTARDSLNVGIGRKTRNTRLSRMPAESTSHRWTYLQLEREKFFETSHIPVDRRPQIYFQFQSPTPGTFLISLHYQGRADALLEMDLKLDDLLEARTQEKTSLDFDYVQIDLERLYALLQRTFLRSRR